MEKIEKPKFFTFNKLNTIIGFLGTVIGIIQFFIPDDVLNLKYKIYIVISIFSIYFLFNLGTYIFSVNKFYKNYSDFHKRHKELNECHLALSEQFTKKCDIIEQKDKIIAEHKYVLLKILEHISNGTLPVTDYEKTYLQNLYNVVYRDIEHLNYIEGDNKK